MNHKKTLFLALALATATAASGQTNGSNSPYSRYGFGLLSDRAQSFNKGMAGTGYGFRSGSEINSKNPAAYSAVDSLTFIFDAGVSLQTANFNDGPNSTNAQNTSIDYLTAGFRLAKNLGMTVGLMPFSTVGYNMSNNYLQKGENGSYLNYTETNKGDGGIHEAFAGIGWRLSGPVSLGVNAGVLWGNITNTITNSFSDGVTNSLRRQYTMRMRTYKVDIGLQIHQPINERNTLTLGVVYGLGHNVNNHSKLYNQTLNTSGTVLTSDTVVAHNAYGLPHTFGVGLNWTFRNRLNIGVDYTLEKWGNVNFPVLNANNEYVASRSALTDSHSFSIGLEYMPDPEGIGYAQHIRYRAGFGYSTGYAKTQSNTAAGTWTSAPRSYIATLGVGIPIANRFNNRSVLSISGQYERVQPTGLNTIKENYFRLCIGLTFNEAWFMKRKID